MGVAAQTYLTVEPDSDPLRLQVYPWDADNTLRVKDRDDNVYVIGSPDGDAPADAQYWVGAADVDLPNAKNLGAFTGIVQNTAGVPTSASASDVLTAFGSQSANTFAGAPSGGAGSVTFRTLAAVDIPALDTSKLTTGQLTVARGGTGADLSATGGANQFVKQSSVGGALSVAAILSADLTSALTTPPAIGGTTPAAGSFTALTGTSVTSTGLIQTTLITEQLRLRYDSSNYASFTVSLGGNLTVAPTGGAMSITGTLTVSSTLSVSSAKFIVDANGFFGQGGAGTSTRIIDQTSVTLTDPATNALGIRAAFTTTFSSNNSTIVVIGTNGGQTVNIGTTAYSTSNGIRGMSGTPIVTGSAGGTAATLIGGFFQNTVTGGITLTNSYAVLVLNPTVTASTLTNNIGFASGSLTNGTNNVYVLLGTTTAPSGNWTLHATTTNDSALAGSLRVRGTTAPTAYLHLGAGTTAASTAPLKFTTGTSMTSAEAGAMEYTTDDLFFTISTSTARKRLLMADAVGGLTSGRVPYVTTNGRLLDASGFTFDGTTLTSPALARPAGTGSGTAKVGGTQFDHFTNAGNVTTGETDLYSDTLQASTLATNGDAVEARYAGTALGSGTATTQLRVYFGGTLIGDSGATSNASADNWEINVLCIRVSSSVVRCTVSIAINGVTLTVSPTYTEVTGLTLSNSQVLKITGTRAGVGAATNDILATLGKVKWLSAA